MAFFFLLKTFGSYFNRDTMFHRLEPVAGKMDARHTNTAAKEEQKVNDLFVLLRCHSNCVTMNDLAKNSLVLFLLLCVIFSVTLFVANASLFCESDRVTG